MKKIHAFGLLLMMILGAGLQAHALKITFEWDIPGSIIVRQSVGGSAMEIASDQTKLEVDDTNQFADYYFFAADGYAIIDADLPNNQKGYPQVATNGANAGQQYYGRRFNSSFNNAVIRINVKKIERTQSFTFNVINGASCLDASFSSGFYKFSLSNGSNTVAMDPAIDKDLSINLITGKGATDIYSVSHNGTPITKKYSTIWEIPGVQPGDKVEVRVFENEEPVVKDCVLNLDIPADLDGCIESIRNWTTGKFIYPEDMTGNKLDIISGTDLQFNLSEDFTYTGFMLGDVDITSKYTNSRIRFVVEDNSTFRIIGAPKDYGTVEFKANVMNPEGVILYQGKYQQNPADLSGGDAVTADVALAKNITLSAASSKLFTLNVDGKNPYIYVAPREGYYIQTVQSMEGGSLSEINSVSPDYTTFYVVAMPLAGARDVKINVKGSTPLKLSANTAKSQSWDNPQADFTIKEGENVISFIPGYHLPLTLRPLGNVNNFAAYLDGQILTVDEEYGSVSVTPYCPEDENDKAMSVVEVYADGSVAKIASVSVTCGSGITAKASYGTLAREITTDGKVNKFLAGTPVTVKPAVAECHITLNGTTVHGYDDQGNFVNGLNEQGEYVFTPTTASAQCIEISAQKLVRIVSLDPADGAVVKSISAITVVTPVFNDGEIMLSTTPEAAAAITLTGEGGETLHPSGIGEVSPAYGPNWEMTGASIPLLFDEPVTTAGKYTLDIPAATFFEMAWDDAAGDMVKVEGGYETIAETAVYTVDPSFKSKIDTYTITPAPGSALNKITRIYIDFTEYGQYDMIQVPDEADAVLSDGTTSYTCLVSTDWDSGKTTRFMVVPVNSDYMEQTITAAGTWTLTIAEGTFSFDGEKSAPIEISYNVDPSNPVYPITPAPGSVTGDLSKIIISFPGAMEVTYNDTPISLTGDEFSSVTNFVNGMSTEFTIEFSSLPYTAGVYTVTIPEGAFTVDGTSSEKVVASFTYEPVWKLTPAPGTEVESLDEIILEFPKATSVDFIGNPQSFILTNGSTYAAPGYDCIKVEDADHPVFRLTIAEGAQQPPLGTLRFTITDDAFVVDGTQFAGITVPYSLNHAVSLDWTVSPEETIVYADYGFDWAFIFDESSRLSNLDRSKIHVSLAGQDLGTGSYEVMTESNMLLMGLYNPELIKEGKLTVRLDAGAFQIWGTPSPVIEYTWNVVAPKEYTWSVTPDGSETVNDLSKITVTFTNADAAELFNEYGISLTKDYNYSEIPQVTAVAGAEVPTFELTFANAPTEAGEYTLTMRIGSFTLDGAQESPEIIVNYNFDAKSGIADILIDGSSTVTVYTLDGRLILKDAPAAELSDLAGGIYIINGQKVLVK